MTAVLEVLEIDGSVVDALRLVGGDVTYERATPEKPSPWSLQAEIDGPIPPLTGGRLLRPVREDWGPLGLFLPTAAPVRLYGYQATYRASGVDLTARMGGRRKLRRSMVLPAGTPITETVRSMVEAAGLHASIHDNDATLRNLLELEVGGSPLEAANRLLVAGGLTCLTPTASEGWLISELWRPPSERAPVDAFANSPGAGRYLPGVEMDPDMLEPPTAVAAISRGGGSSLGVVGYWSDGTPTTSPAFLEESIMIDATSQESANAQARQYGITRRPSRRISFVGTFRKLMPGDVIRFSHSFHGVKCNAELLTKRVPLIGPDVSYGLQEVA